MIFRVFFGEPNEEARELEHGHIHHAEPVNPSTGEPEDTDVGYPGSVHHIAERESIMRWPMSILALLAIVGGVVQIPGVTHVIENFLDPAFTGSRFIDIEVSTGHEVLALVVGAIVSVTGIGLAYLLYIRNPGTTIALARRLPRLHGFLARKWYFDEAYDLLIVRPIGALGRAASRVFEPDVIDGVTTGTTEVVRAGNRFVRIAQSGLLRYYALLLLTGLTALGLYFLIVAR
jgi:NADH-quinone oxidoreductase subunit L